MIEEQIAVRVPVVWLETRGDEEAVSRAFVRAFASFGMRAQVIADPEQLARVSDETDVAVWTAAVPPAFSALHVAIGVDTVADIVLRGDEQDIERIAASVVAPLIER